MTPRDARDPRGPTDQRDSRDIFRAGDRRDTLTLRILTVSVACLIVAVVVTGIFLIVRQHDLNVIQDRLDSAVSKHAAEDQSTQLSLCNYWRIQGATNPALRSAAEDFVRILNCPKP